MSYARRRFDQRGRACRGEARGVCLEIYCGQNLGCNFGGWIGCVLGPTFEEIPLIFQQPHLSASQAGSIKSARCGTPYGLHFLARMPYRGSDVSLREREIGTGSRATKMLKEFIMNTPSVLVSTSALYCHPLLSVHRRTYIQTLGTYSINRSRDTKQVRTNTKITDNRSG